MRYLIVVILLIAVTGLIDHEVKDGGMEQVATGKVKMDRLVNRASMIGNCYTDLKPEMFDSFDSRPNNTLNLVITCKNGSVELDWTSVYSGHQTEVHKL